MDVRRGNREVAKLIFVIVFFEILYAWNIICRYGYMYIFIVNIIF